MTRGANTDRLRVVLLTHGGAEEALRRLAALPRAEVVGVFVETNVERERPLRERLRRSVRYDGWAATAAKLARKALARRGGGDAEARRLAEGRDRLESVARECGVRLHRVADYHDAGSLALMREAAPDLGVIYGTNIVREPVFALPPLGSINLHKGLAPLYRGGPPVFWELFNGEQELGVTVHYVAAKVDAGDILLQRRVPLAYDYAAHGDRFESFIEEFSASLNATCAEMIAEAVRLIASGEARPAPQDVTLGRRYRLPTKREKDELRRRLRRRHDPKSVAARGRRARDAEEAGAR